VLTLWAAVVAERLGYARDEALTLGRAVAGLNAKTKAERIGLHGPPKRGATKRPERPRAPLEVELLGRRVPCVRTAVGLRAAERGKPSDPASVERYLAGKFGAALGAARKAFATLAASYPPAALAEEAFALYERFRPAVPRGAYGWGARGELDLDLVRELAREARAR
jgi:hypothetical protein